MDVRGSASVRVSCFVCLRAGACVGVCALLRIRLCMYARVHLLTPDVCRYRLPRTIRFPVFQKPEHMLTKKKDEAGTRPLHARGS